MGNLIVDKKEGKVIIEVNPKIYALDVIYAAAYVFIDKSYILLDGDPEKSIKIELRLKKDINEKDVGLIETEKELKKLGQEFLNELLNYSFYKKQSEKNKNLRETILNTALLGALNKEDKEKNRNFQNKKESMNHLKKLVNIDKKDSNLINDNDIDDFLKDYEDIEIPWEEEV